jgi:hypothetical protein
LSLQPPELSEPYGTEAERAHDRETLVLYWFAIETLTRLAQLPPDEWSSNQQSLFPTALPDGFRETPDSRLTRWVNLYSDEIHIIRDIRNKLVHGGLVADAELRGVDFLARNVIATATGTMPSQAEATARKVIALATLHSARLD